MVNEILPSHNMDLRFQLWQLLLGRLVLYEAYKEQRLPYCKKISTDQELILCVLLVIFL